jgi:Flp pilus assembly pilin Flp
MARHRNRTRSRGAINVEYTVLVGTVGLASMLALVGLGVAILRSFEFVRSFVLYPYP